MSAPTVTVIGPELQVTSVITKSRLTEDSTTNAGFPPTSTMLSNRAAEKLFPVMIMAVPG